MSLHGENEEAENVADWKEDEDAFESHFGLAYEDFTDIVSSGPPELITKYEATRKVNEEAAILWLIHEAKNHGLLESE